MEPERGAGVKSSQVHLGCISPLAAERTERAGAPMNGCRPKRRPRWAGGNPPRRRREVRPRRRPLVFVCDLPPPQLRKLTRERERGNGNGKERAAAADQLVRSAPTNGAGRHLLEHALRQAAHPSKPQFASRVRLRLLACRPTFMMLPLFRPASHRVASARACATRLTKLAAACERRVRELKANEFEKINSRRAANELM